MSNSENQEAENEEKLKEYEKLQKIEKEKRQLLNSAISGRITNLKERVAFLLNNFVDARNSDKELAWLYWQNFESEISNGYVINKEQFIELTNFSSIQRARQKIQNEYKLFQASDVIKKYRGVLEEDKKQAAIEDKPSYPFYTIYIDETGKNQNYLSVGSLWLTDTKAAFFGSFKLKEWINRSAISYEFHFSELKNHKLEAYKAFFLQFLTLNPSAGFKVIVIDRKGFKNTNTVITDLTFHLINKGIAHENESKRAPLPRLLQVWLDDEEKGVDKLKIENIKERIVSQNIDGLFIDNIDALKSEGNIYLQIVDLFISSINRKIHTPNGKKAKDKLADFILGLLNFDITSIDENNNDIDKSAIFNLTYKSK